MNTKSLTISIIFLIIFANFTLIQAQCQNKIIYVDDDNISGPWDGSKEYPYKKIQSGIIVASKGDIIYVDGGYYQENIIIDKSIDVIGDDKENTIIDGSRTGDVVFISADKVSISGFTIQNSGVTNDGDNTDSGIDIRSSQNRMFNNIVRLNNYGIYIKESNNDIHENTIINNSRYGVLISGGSCNNISHNDISYNIKKYESFSGAGIFITKGSECNILNNDITYNTYGIRLYASNINITNNNIMYNDEAMKLTQSNRIFISRNNVKNPMILSNLMSIDHSDAFFYQNNFLSNHLIYMNGGEIIWEHTAFCVYKSKNTWNNNYWGRPYPLFKIINPFQYMRPKPYIYTDIDINPAYIPFTIANQEAL